MNLSGTMRRHSYVCIYQQKYASFCVRVIGAPIIDYSKSLRTYVSWWVAEEIGRGGGGGGGGSTKVLDSASSWIFLLLYVVVLTTGDYRKITTIRKFSLSDTKRKKLCPYWKCRT